MIHRKSWGALALLAITAACSKTGVSGDGARKGVSEGTFRVLVQNGQTSAALQIQGGRVYTDDGQLDCGVDDAGNRLGLCAAEFPSPATVVLHAAPSGADSSLSPARPFTFLGWAGDCSGEGDCTLSGRADRYVVATFGAVRSGHPNFTDPAVHGPAWTAYAERAPGALDCRSCHGAHLQGQGIAGACTSCHPWPLASSGALSWDQGRWDELSWR
ncbi:hypothetical protein [Anaeromyxobacter oryzae]|uniref:Lipoprotein n=1 Tax=Anaeromyxobacter oryzae TaxID=2918170 RepID=A0ABM7X3B5_9BACT|nr:hypothetical protein [Anaeromyxobacter oryzae]BDG06274.1 hypothetical protein AMOR_52700 [Anaeromyxobacter oryzae]